MPEILPETGRSDRSKRLLSMIATEAYWGPRAEVDRYVHLGAEAQEEGSRTVRLESYPDGSYDVVFDSASPVQQ